MFRCTFEPRSYSWQLRECQHTGIWRIHGQRVDASNRRAIGNAMLVLDALILVAAMPMALALQAIVRSHFGAFKLPVPFEQFLLVAYIALPCMLALIALMGLHRTHEAAWTTIRVAVGVIKLHVMALLIMAAIAFTANIQINRSVVGLYLSITFCLMLCARWMVRFAIRREFELGLGREHVIIISDDLALAERLMSAMTQTDSPAKLSGIVWVGGERQRELSITAKHLPFWIGVESLAGALHEATADTVVYAPNEFRADHFEVLVDSCAAQGKRLKLWMKTLDGFNGAMRVEREGSQSLIVIPYGEKHGEALVVKRSMDILVSLGAIVVLSPILMLAALAILITMGRPIFHRQDRVGLHGRRFTMLKFRSMIANAEALRAELNHLNEVDGPVFKIARDPRITRLGRILRRCSIDELPQLFNVLAGTMSIVGPRPLPIAEQQSIHGSMRRRLSMRPGITGLWQVSGRSDLSFDQWIKKDLEYVDHWSVKMDIKILALTVPAVVSGRGAR